MKRMNKKGFTLAELLIVVGIIAVLTAIAVPLFVGALNNAEDSVKQANIRAVRVQAVSKILLATAPTDAPTKDSDTTTDGIFKAAKDGETAYKWVRASEYYVTANISESGAISNLKIAQTHAEYTADVCASAAKGVNAKYTVTIKLTTEDLNTQSVAGA